jgi:starch synthase (maltosyl-transferring)
MSLPASDPPERRRVIIANVTPQVDGGRYAVKRVVGDSVKVEADAYAEGHDEITVLLMYRAESEGKWRSVEMRSGYDARWYGEFSANLIGNYYFTVMAWPDRFRTWRRDLEKRVVAEQDVQLELVIGADMMREAAVNAPAEAAKRLKTRADAIEKDGDGPQKLRADMAMDQALLPDMLAYAPRQPLTVYEIQQRVFVDRERARFSAWYELFPRSTSPIPGRHGTFKTTIAWLPYISQMGFDVLYLPPVHPIGTTNRKGPNNNPEGHEGDAGSPWAIGSAAGGHKAVAPELGTLADFKALVEAAKGRDMEVALDIALQCSPDHPYVIEHPQWFKHRPDGSIRYAENPPKLYQDIYPIDFETEDWRALWDELESIFRFWIEQGVKIFRVDNPHTKPFAFWEWLIERIKKDHPDVLFLAEAFTRPRTMESLAKLGFSQSYTYFTWRNNKWDLEQYIKQVTTPPVSDYFRPNFWPNTPDILHEFLQHGGRPAFVMRLILAATLSASYGIYGPSFELGLHTAREPGTEEYADSEKYEVKHWDVSDPNSLQHLISRVNRVRHENPALQRNDTLKLLHIDNENLLAYMKTAEDDENVVICVVNLDPYNTQGGTLQVPWWELGMEKEEAYQMHDMLDSAYYNWRGEWNYVQLNPHVLPAHVFALKRTSRPAVEMPRPL